MPNNMQAKDTIKASTIHLFPSRPIKKTDCKMDRDKNEWINCNVVNVAKAYYRVRVNYRWL